MSSTKNILFFLFCLAICISPLLLLAITDTRQAENACESKGGALVRLDRGGSVCVQVLK